MPAALSDDLRRRIVDAYACGGTSMAALAARFAVAAITVRRLVKRTRDGLPISPTIPARPPVPRLVRPEHEAHIEAWLRAEPSLAQHQLAARLTALIGRAICQQTAGRAVARMGYTRKKTGTSGPATERRGAGRACRLPPVAGNVAHARCTRRGALDGCPAGAPSTGALPGRVFCVDESGLRVGERLRYGYARRGEPCIETAPYRLGVRTNLVGFVASDGTGAVTAIEGDAVCRRLFCHVMREQLVPRLRQGDTVVWDNHSIHKDAALVAEIEANGASVVWLPRYSPEMNPAEWLWSHVKRSVRQACADTAAALGEALGEALAQAITSVPSEHVTGWVRHGGFRDQPA